MTSSMKLFVATIVLAGCREVRIADGGDGSGGASATGAVVGSSSSGPNECSQDCEGGACVGGVCQPFAIAEGFLPGDLVTDGQAVFVTNADTGEVLRFAKSGGPPSIVAHGDAEAWRLALTGDDVLWGGAEGIWRAPKLGGDAFQIMDAPVHVGPIAIDGSMTYFAKVEGFGSIHAVPTDGGADDTIENYASLAYDVVVHRGVKDYSRLYWVSQDAGTGELHRLVLDGQSKPEVAVSGMTLASEILDAPEGLYVADSGLEGGVVRLNPSGIVESLLAAQPTPAGLAVDQDYLYVTLLGTGENGGAIVRVGRFEATGLEIVAKGLSYPSAIAADEHALYWIQQSPGAVMKLVK
jgi:hypothetical protein